MKAIDDIKLPDDMRYSEEHKYARSLDGKYRIGITDYAQDQLGDIVYVELPVVGDTFEQGSEFGTIESMKAIVELYIPLGGEVVTINAALEDYPELVNSDPYGDGWMIEVKPDDPAAFERLMTADAYRKILE